MFKEELNKFIEEFDKRLGAYVNQVSALYNNYDKEGHNILSNFFELVLRPGKRIRPALCYVTYKMLGGKNTKEAYNAGIALELLHAYLLVLDDIMDRGETRRGGKCVHKKYEDYFSSLQLYNLHNQDKKHFGISLGMTSGIIGPHLAINILMGLPIEKKTMIELVSLVNHNILITAFGQARDVFDTYSWKIDEENIIKTLEQKTGVYTFENPMMVGAILANAQEEQKNYIKEFAYSTGIVYQVQDDIIGMFGVEKTTGKDSLSDLREGKPTLLFSHLLKSLEGDIEKTNKIKSLFGNESATAEDLDYIRLLIKEKQVLEYVEKIKSTHVEQAKESIEKMNEDFSSEGKKFLFEMLEYIVSRDK